MTERDKLELPRQVQLIHEVLALLDHELRCGSPACRPRSRFAIACRVARR
jgi:hypothetical protein